MQKYQVPVEKPPVVASVQMPTQASSRFVRGIQSIRLTSEERLVLLQRLQVTLYGLHDVLERRPLLLQLCELLAKARQDLVLRDPSEVLLNLVTALVEGFLGYFASRRPLLLQLRELLAKARQDLVLRDPSKVLLNLVTALVEGFLGYFASRRPCGLLLDAEILEELQRCPKEQKLGERLPKYDILEVDHHGAITRLVEV